SAIAKSKFLGDVAFTRSKIAFVIFKIGVSEDDAEYMCSSYSPLLSALFMQVLSLMLTAYQGRRLMFIAINYTS
ncbi:hypothetical protein HAX54_015127, partial [Datura stramonium]|nr:hypothetical protein [Datura stramonium]